MAVITDEYMRQMQAQARTYSLVLLKRAAGYHDPDAGASSGNMAAATIRSGLTAYWGLCARSLTTVNGQASGFSAPRPARQRGSWMAIPRSRPTSSVTRFIRYRASPATASRPGRRPAGNPIGRYRAPRRGRSSTREGGRCSPPACSGRMRQAPTLWRRRSGSPCSSSVPMAALAGWRRSSATTRRQPPSVCAGSGRC